MSQSHYIPSVTPGHHWSIYVYKPQGRPAYACAVEGVLEDTGTSFQSFTTMLFQSRQRRVQLNGNNTAKNRAHALAVLHADMVEAGEIERAGYFPIF